MRGFLWSNNETSSGFRWVNWREVCCYKQQGRLAIRPPWHMLPCMMWSIRRVTKAIDHFFFKNPQLLGRGHCLRCFDNSGQDECITRGHWYDCLVMWPQKFFHHQKFLSKARWWWECHWFSVPAMWKSKEPLKVYFAWAAIKGMIRTDDMLKWRSFNGRNWCFMFREEEEMANHLPIHCCWASSLW